MTDNFLVGWKRKIEYADEPIGVLIINGATAHEFMAKWKELMKEYNNDIEVVWSKIVWLFDCKFESLSE